MTLTLFIIFFVLIIINVPIAISLTAATLIPLAVFTDIPLLVVVQRFFTAINAFTMLAVPFFMMAGGLMDKGGVSKRLVRLANSLVCWLPGGLAIVVFLASAFFGAISGSATATVIAIGSIMIPAMKAEGYSMGFTLATVASAGFLGVVIPPSIPMVMYGLSSGASIGELFIGGIIPGLLLTLSMSAVAFFYGKKHLKIRHKFSLRELWLAFKDSLWALLMPVIILGGIYSGVFTATEAAAVACLYGVIVGFLIYREMDIKAAWNVVKDSVVGTSMIFFIVMSASALGFMMSREMIPQKIAAFMISLSGGTPIIFMLLVTVLLLIVGTFMETIPAILILTPILAPVLKSMNIDVVAFGVFMVVNLGIGMTTPPVGVNLFCAARLQKVKVDVVINKHLLHYMAACIAVLLLLVFVPQLITFLPRVLL